MVAYLLDENVNESGRVKAHCTELGIEIYRVHDFGLLRTEDRIIFQFAQEHGYVIVTGNIYEFRSFQNEVNRRGELFLGAIYIPPQLQKNTELIIRRIVEVETEEYYLGGEWWVRE
ncbi:MAG: DUF5615 family PIN-like protein [Anaerolineae bacterium]|nr:DUF5615 family PIN-like protein [Anaerolineae bacterium]